MLQEQLLCGHGGCCLNGTHFSLTVGTRCLLRCSMFISSSNVRLRESKVTCGSRRVCFMLMLWSHSKGWGRVLMLPSTRTMR